MNLIQMRKQMRAEAEDFARENLADCAAELLELHDTALLRDEKVRKLSRMCAAWAGRRNPLNIAKQLIEREALRFACGGLDMKTLLAEYLAYNGEYAASMPSEQWVERVKAAIAKLEA